MMRIAILSSALCAFIGTAEARDNKCVSGQFPDKLPAISIENTPGASHTVGAALEQLSKQAGWSLLLLSHTAFDDEIDLRATNVPANQLLETLCSEGHLKIELKGTTLRVTDNDEDNEDEDQDAEQAEADSNKSDGHHFHHDSRVVTGQDLVIAEDEEVDQAVATGGSLDVKGHVRGDAVALGGKLTVRSTARIDGDVVGIGGPVVIEPGAKLHGDRVNIGGSVGNIIRGLAARGLLHSNDSSSHDSDDDHESIFATVLGKVLRALLAFVLGLLLISFAPDRVKRVSSYIEGRPMLAAGAGFLLTICFIPLCVMLAITLIGIPLIPVLFVALLLLVLFGYTALLMYVGEKLPVLQDRKTPLLALAIGAGVMLIIDLVPYIGPFIVLSAALVAAGAALLSRLGTHRDTTPPPSSLSTMP